MRGVLKYLIFLVLPITLIILWLAGVFHHRISAKEIEIEREIVYGLKLSKPEIVNTIVLEFTGTVIPSDRAEVSTRHMGYVSYVGVKEGDYVRKGKVIVRIDLRDVKAQIESARQRVIQARKQYESALANYEAVKITYERYKKLLEEKAITQHEFDMIEAKFRAAKAQLEAAKTAIKMAEEQLKAVSTNLSYTEIRAPFSGYVVKKLVDVGDIARPGYPLVIMEKPPYKVEVSLPEKFFGRIKKGDELKVYIPALKQYYTARVVEIEPSVNPQSRTFKVKAVIEGKNLRSGFYAKVYIEEPVKKTVLIPESAIYRRWDFTGVWVVDEENVLELRFVRLGRRFDGKVEVLSGLDGDETIVIEGLEKACEGCKVGG